MVKNKYGDEMLSTEYGGIDVSLTGTGCCLASPWNQLTWVYGKDGVTTLEGIKRIDVISEMAEFIVSHFVTHKNLRGLRMVGIEGYSFGSRGMGATTLGELGGLIRMFLLNEQIPFVEIPPKSLKLFVTGKGSATKEKMALGAYKTWGVEFPTNDETDAFGLSKMVACLDGAEEPMNAHQKRALKVLEDSWAAACRYIRRQLLKG